MGLVCKQSIQLLQPKGQETAMLTNLQTLSQTMPPKVKGLADPTANTPTYEHLERTTEEEHTHGNVYRHRESQLQTQGGA